MKHASLFSGIGGFDLAAQWMGWENIFNCEIDPFCRRVLNYYWPGAISYKNIKETDFTPHANTIDILTGGFPCQPYSLAGLRKGKEDERHLWPEMLRAIRQIKPRWVVGENVFGLVSWDGGLVFNEVCADLEAEGYQVQPFILPAAAVNAPHGRDRVWFVAYAHNNGPDGAENRQGNIKRNDSDKAGQETIIKPAGCSCKAVDANTNSKGLQRLCINGVDREKRAEPYDKQFSGPVCGNWKNFPTQPPICGRDDGFSSGLDGITFPKLRSESIKGYGNAIVPQVAMQIFKAIQEYETLHA